MPPPFVLGSYPQKRYKGIVKRCKRGAKHLPCTFVKEKAGQVDLASLFLLTFVREKAGQVDLASLFLFAHQTICEFMIHYNRLILYHMPYLGVNLDYNFTVCWKLLKLILLFTY